MNVYKFHLKLNGQYGIGILLCAANTKEEAKEVVAKHDPSDIWILDKKMSNLQSSEKTPKVILLEYYVE